VTPAPRSAGWGWSAVAAPGASQQPAKDDGGVDQRQPELHHQPATFGAPARACVLVAPRMGTLHRPTTAGLDGGLAARGWGTSPATLRSASTCRQLVVVTGVQVQHRSGGQHPDHRDGVKGRASSPSLRRLAGAATAPSGTPPASVERTERFSPCLRRPPGSAWRPARRRAPWWCTRPLPGAPAPARTAAGRRRAPPAPAARRPSADPLIPARRSVVAEQVPSASRQRVQVHI
jgi:hypothetical protein